ncbi:hypothetical protein ACN27F_10465 [Solwaraspora sp. WMMB335]|uniref:hypothetical protein n=1 Tax=Solwaraspora sp. WMMB335 TaxID=3404118 RepID=UPI003B95C088
MAGATIDPLFSAETAIDANLPGALRRLAAGTSAIVRWPNLCDGGPDGLSRSITSATFEPYDVSRLDPPILKVGPAVYDHYTRGAVGGDYWHEAGEARARMSAMFGGVDPADLLLQRLSRCLSLPVRPASIRGRDLHVGILREFTSGSRIHYDEISREFPGHFDVEPIVQLAFNLHLTAAASGGALTVWRHRWVPGDDKARDGYGWAEDLLVGTSSATLLAMPGDGVFFDCRNFHKVDDFAGGRRVTFSFFLGFTISGELIAWS